MKFIGIVGEEALKLFCDSHNLQPSTSIHVHLLHTLSEPRERCNDPDLQQIDVLQAGIDAAAGYTATAWQRLVPRQDDSIMHTVHNYTDVW